MPATCGVAIDVPESTCPAAPPPDAADRMPVPGAATSGFTMPSDPCTPRDEPELIRSPAPTCVPRIARLGPICSRREPASISLMSASVEDFVSWMPGIAALPEMPAENTSTSVGSTTPAAPAFEAFVNRATEPHTRAGVSSHHRYTIRPATAAACSGVNGVQPSNLAPRNTTGAVTSAPPAYAIEFWPANVWPRSAAASASMTRAASSTGAPTELATVSELAALPGAPPTSVMSPALPEATATTTPSLVSSSTSRLSGSSAGEPSEPSDMLTTSTWSDRSPSPFGSAARSRARLVRFVEPPMSPKTLNAQTVAPGAEPGPICQSETSVRSSYPPVNVVPLSVTPYPAAEPATCVPWPELGDVDSESMGFASGVGTSVEPGSSRLASYSGPAKS